MPPAACPTTLYNLLLILPLVIVGLNLFQHAENNVSAAAIIVACLFSQIADSNCFPSTLTSYIYRLPCLVSSWVWWTLTVGRGWAEVYLGLAFLT